MQCTLCEFKIENKDGKVGKYKKRTEWMPMN